MDRVTVCHSLDTICHVVTSHFHLPRPRFISTCSRLIFLQDLADLCSLATYTYTNSVIFISPAFYPRSQPYHSFYLLHPRREGLAQIVDVYLESGDDYQGSDSDHGGSDDKDTSQSLSSIQLYLNGVMVVLNRRQ